MHLLYAYPGQPTREGTPPTDGDGYVWAVNSRYTPSAAGLVADATLFDSNGTVVSTKTTTFTEPLEADGVRRLMNLDGMYVDNLLHSITCDESGAYWSCSSARFITSPDQF